MTTPPGKPQLRLKRWGAVIGTLFASIAPWPPAWALCPAELPAAIDAITANRPELQRARLGIQVETLDGTVIYSESGDRFFVPASALKLLTTAAVLTRYGPDGTIRTSIYGTTNAAGLTTLRVVGRGDPSLDSSDIESLADQIAQRGVRQVSLLIGDESTLPGSAVNPNWEWEDVQAGYGAQANALILNGNALRLQLAPQGLGEPLRVVWDTPALADLWEVENRSRTVAAGAPEFIEVGRDLARPVLRVGGQLVVGSNPEPTAIAIPNPGEAFLTSLSEALARRNIPVGRTQLTQTAIADPGPELAAVQSPPLAELLVPANRDSNNLYAEALLRWLGRSADAAQDTTEAGAAIALRVLADLGIDTDDVVMVDGSGLARKNLVTPRVLVAVLQVMARSPHANLYRDSLAVSGVNGTLRNRLRGTPAEGRIWGKSGAISRNFSLTGYLEPPRYNGTLAFSILLNNVNVSGGAARSLIDEIMVPIAQLESCN
ncbi:MAG: D-alanyl-D-alanine carboxypeptidase/D-alanyl-D-alanine-endopeptidase [Leptolyngbyaceae cyanobacterium T60_A2020_046]|nr:D-alanyl-D-alanine carboxypeptidase/D-alanyl-D-alanine-endopeptidase [Leptolyngbyaceae cyanobacterium T60_A2020_046]